MSQFKFLTLSWRGPLSYRHQYIDLLDWFLYNNGSRNERVNLETTKKNQFKTIKQSKGTCIRFPYKPSKQLEELQFSRSVAKKW